jgi:hypothetical protein
MNALDAMECGPQRRGGAEECLLGDGDADGADGRRCALATAS